MTLLSDWDYELPDRLIAQTPLSDRADSRLLVLCSRTGEQMHMRFRDVANVLRPGDLLVANDTKVTARRLFGTKASGGRVEALLLGPSDDDETYLALMKPGARLKPGIKVHFEGGFEALISSDKGDGVKELKFSDDVSKALPTLGTIPLPPYIHQLLQDDARYQTVYARSEGSAAAPTAGLHFTPELIRTLNSSGIDFATVTLDVSIDTFRPVQAQSIEEHRIHGERCEISEETADKIAECTGRIIAVGTTSVRTLESFAFDRRRVNSGSKISKLFIRPGYEFKVVDGMFTNFHLPRTSMLMMVAAMCGREALFAAYREALARNYRFLSFGDSMLVIPTVFNDV